MPALRAIKSSRSGFTLIEVLVATSILTVLVLAYCAMANSTSKIWLAGSGHIERRRNLRAIGEFVASDMRAALLPVQGKSDNKPNLQFLLNPPALKSKYPYHDCAFWQAPIATEMTLGDIAEVGYFVQWDSLEESPAGKLCRFFVNPSTGGSGSAATLNPNFLIFKDLSSWVTPELVKTVAPADKENAYLGLFTENVLGLWLQPYDLNGVSLASGGNNSFDSRVGYKATFIGSDGNQQWKEDRFLPAKIVISIAQIDSTAAPRFKQVAESLRSLSSSSNCTSADAYLLAVREAAKSNGLLRSLLPNIQIYSTEVQLQNAR